MGRVKRVTDMSTFELERLLLKLETDLMVEAMLYDGTLASERLLGASERLWRRVARELAKRDYRERPHGRRCACSDCLALKEQMIHLQRRPPR